MAPGDQVPEADISFPQDLGRRFLGRPLLRLKTKKGMDAEKNVAYVILSAAVLTL
jgi:hypothetical protein